MTGTEAPRGSGRDLRWCPARTRRRKVQPKGRWETAENGDPDRKAGGQDRHVSTGSVAWPGTGGDVEQMEARTTADATAGRQSTAAQRDTGGRLRLARCGAEGVRVAAALSGRVETERSTGVKARTAPPATARHRTCGARPSRITPPSGRTCRVPGRRIPSSRCSGSRRPGGSARPNRRDAAHKFMEEFQNLGLMQHRRSSRSTAPR